MHEPFKIDWANIDAARFACENWHYSKCLPTGKLIKIGVWEYGQFVGVIIFSRGATPNIGKPFGLEQTEICELTRIAMTNHKTPVSKCISIAIRFLKKQCPGVRAIVSYADMDQQHHGGIYQASNWKYFGVSNPNSRDGFMIGSKKVHPRSIGAKGGIQSLDWVRRNMDANATIHISTGKHKYLYFFDKQLERQFKHLVRPYPKRGGSTDVGAGSFHDPGDGSIPIPPLQLP